MKRILNRLCSIHDAITDAAAVLASIGLATIVCSYVFEVVTRYFFNAPTSWVSDYVSYALVASIFLALPKVSKDKGHVAVTILVDIIPERAAGLVHTLVSLIGFLCLAFAAWVSLMENIRQYTRGIETLAITPIPVWWVSSFITFGLAFSAIYFLRHASPDERVGGGIQTG